MFKRYVLILFLVFRAFEAMSQKEKPSMRDTLDNRLDLMKNSSFTLFLFLMLEIPIDWTLS
jgi:hypothetical protein